MKRKRNDNLVLAFCFAFFTSYTIVSDIKKNHFSKNVDKTKDSVEKVNK